jgi:hypothetical protein
MYSESPLCPVLSHLVLEWQVFLDPHLLGRCLSELGHVLMLAGQLDSAQDSMEQGERVLLAAEDEHELATLRCRMGLLLATVPEGSSKISSASADAAFEKITQSLEVGLMGRCWHLGSVMQPTCVTPCVTFTC